MTTKTLFTPCTNRYLGGNQLTSVPSFIPKLENLTYLDLHNNRLTSLPLLTNLTKLCIFSAMNNKITAIPDNLFAPTAPVQIYLHNNPINYI